MEQFLKTKLGKGASWALAAVIFAEAILLAAFLGMKDPLPVIAHLTKVGDEYLVIWRSADPGEEPMAKRTSSLQAALDFAHTELNLQVLQTATPAVSFEKLWIESHGGRHALHWKVEGNPFIFRLTFAARNEADLFASAFRGGGYSPSGVGHSIVLRSRSADASY